MDHGSELSELPHSSSSTGSSSHGSFQLDPESTASSSFSFDRSCNDSNDTDGKYSKLAKVSIESTSSDSKVSDATDEPMLQNRSPTQSPPIQIMKKSGDFDSNNSISTSVPASDPSTPDSFSFEPWRVRKDKKGTHSKLEGVFNVSMSTASESEQQNMSPTHSPTIQVMEKTAGYDSNRIPYSNFTSKSPSPTEWSNGSNESLFSIPIGNHSFSRDAILKAGRESYKSVELDTHGEVVRHRHMSFAPKGGENTKETPDKSLRAGSIPRTTGIPVEPIKDGVDDQHTALPIGITKKSEATWCEWCFAGCCCCCSRLSQCNSRSGCLCAWLSCRGFSCKWFSRLCFCSKCLRCFCKRPKCQGCCSGWPCLNCCSCKCCSRCCCEFPCLKCSCCESISSCSIWKCCCKNSRSTFDTVAKDGGRVGRAAA